MEGGDEYVELARKKPPLSLRGDTMGDYWSVCNRNRDKLSNLDIKMMMF